MSTIGERIKKIRTDLSMTQKDFAEKISVSRPFISRVESNKETPSDTLIKLISFTFDVSYKWIRFGVGEKNEPKNIPKTENFLNIRDNAEFMSALLGTNNYNKTRTFSHAVSILSNIFQNDKIKDYSDVYFQQKVIMYLAYLRSFCLMINIKDTDLTEDEITCNTLKNISILLEEIKEAFTNENMNEKIDEG